jgi:two-component system NtrC family sensor kinase
MKLEISIKDDWRIRVFDSLSFPTLILRLDRTIISANQIFLKMIGVELDKITGKTCKEIFSRYFEDQRPSCSDHDCPFPRLIKDGKGCSVLRKIKTSAGEDRWEDRVFSPILDDDGNVKYVMESVRDITRIKTLEKAFSGIRELVSKVIQSSPSAIVAADRKGKIILMNAAAEELLGYTFDEVKDFSVERLYQKGIAREILKKLLDKNLGEKGKLPITKVNIITKTGQTIPVEMTAAIIYEDSREVATMGIFNDLREQLAVEKQLQEAQAQVVQSEKLASLGRLAAGVAHEINNPLTSILLFGNMMLEKIEKNHPLQQKLEYILEDAERCKDIVKNLLVYSRSKSPSKERFELNALVEESLHLIRDQRFFMNITLVKEMSNDPIPIHVDKNQLAQVVINLIINAVDAMDNKGTLTFRTYRDEMNKMACLEVQDTGSGIPPELISKVFDPFFTTKNPGKGTGLGLSTVYGIVKENKGRISIGKTGPEGTTFILELPIEMPAEDTLFDSIG